MVDAAGSKAPCVTSPGKKDQNASKLISDFVGVVSFSSPELRPATVGKLEMICYLLPRVYNVADQKNFTTPNKQELTLSRPLFVHQDAW